MSEKLKAPFPYFGGKSTVAHLVWERLGNVRNYVEPFFGSGAVLLARPHEPGTETVNDLDGYLCNFWRALQAAPDEVAKWADWPVSECDLLARHRWLIEQKPCLNRLKTEPDFFDAKIAGWWVWGKCTWIGDEWCVRLANKIPHLGDAGTGVNRKSIHLESYLASLSDRLCNVRITCGDWQRVLGPSVTEKHGLTGIFLDPPYGEGDMDYSAGGNTSSVAQDVAKWAAENGHNPLLRIAVCGYEGAIEMLDNWTCVAWKAKGGYGSQGDGAGRENCKRERIWFSPHCLCPQADLFNLDLFSEAA